FGFEPQVFEQAPDLLEVGAAILMWPNAIRVLQRLGLAETICRRGGILEQGCWLNRDGRLIKQFRLPKFAAPALALHRAELQRALLDALPRDWIHLGHVFETYEQSPGEILVHFGNRSPFASDVLIAADGIHSRARTQLLNDGPPPDRGYLAWRGVVPYTPALITPATAIEIYGPGRRFGIGPLGSGRVGWWASANESLSSTEAGNTQDELLRLFDGWWEPVVELIQATPLSSLVRNTVCDRRPRRGWGTGAMTLLGDAIHPTTPNLGQGGCLAIEDAAVLAHCLQKYAADRHPDLRSQISSALRRFENLRYSRTAAMARYSRVYGTIGQWEGPPAVRLRRLGQSLLPAIVIERFLQALFRYDANAVRI
ncbi:MAG TPA: FAD-dependent monooxygenase, partial [Pyrinomonadaceae bacterium]|nr:FAD-dependent monooxygenase [Pyrinomonadaceae bacterium]